VSSRRVTARTGENSIVLANSALRGSAASIALVVQKRRLRPGTYLVTVTTLDAGGRAQSSARVKFWVIRP
jgi:hypothetical protein